MRRRQSSDSSESSSSEQELRRENERLQAAVQSACNAQIELRQLVEHLTAAPWHAARMLQIMSMPQGTRALVWTGEGARAVGLHPDVDPSELPAGGAVFLSTDRNLVMSPAPEELLRTGETAVFERFTPDGRLVLRSRDEELVAEASARLDVAQLRSGDHVLLSCSIATPSLRSSASRTRTAGATCSRTSRTCRASGSAGSVAASRSWSPS
jgi:hypothetical protein